MGKHPAHAPTPNPLINPPQNGTWIILAKTQHVIAMYKDGKKILTITDFSIGGKHDGVMHPTPEGRFEVIRKDETHVSHSYRDKSTGKWAPMPFYVQFAENVGFHIGNTAASSHGCIHLAPDDAHFIFKNSEVGKTHVWVLKH